MNKDLFNFKQFTVSQERCAMKVGTDGVLLGAWAGIHSISAALDVGTGSGVVALMLAQRFKCEVVGVEVDKDAAGQAQENFMNSSWASRLSLVHSPFQEFAEKTHKKFDLIVSNPPYFSEDIKSPNYQRSLARHSENLTLEELVDRALHLINHSGCIAFILPYNKRKQLIQAMIKNGLWMQRESFVHPIPHEEPNRILVEMGLESKPIVRRETIVIEENKRHLYHSSFRQLTKDFYLY